MPRDRIGLLWDVCQIPDFRKTLTDSHARLLGRIYMHLVSPEGRLPGAWVAEQLARPDRTDGDLAALLARIAATRTWTYFSHPPGRLEAVPARPDPTRAIRGPP